MAIFQKVIQKKLSFYRIRWVIFLAPHAHWIGCLSCNLEPFLYCSGSNREGKVWGSWNMLGNQQIMPLDPLMVCMHPSTTTSLVNIASGSKAAYLAFLSSELPNGAAFQPTKRTTGRPQVKQILCHKINPLQNRTKNSCRVFWGSSHFLSSPIGLGFVQGGRKKLNIRGLNIQQIPDGYNVAFGCDALDAEVPDTIKNNWRNPWL